MPEIAEVALMADSIRYIMCEQSLQNIVILAGRYLDTNMPNLIELNGCLPLKFISVNVKGKFCWIELQDKWYIAITFGMSGGIYYDSSEHILQSKYMKNFHIQFINTIGQSFYFGDPRRFGTVNIYHDRIQIDKKLSQLGPDMLTGEPITDSQFVAIFRQRQFNDKNICKVLMEQKAVSGVGNYIKSEVLYACGINPWALVSDLTDQDLIQMYHQITTVAKQAYLAHGASLYTYTGSDRQKGTFGDMLKVYGKNADPIGTTVVVVPDKSSPDKRTTHYVPCKQLIGNHRDPNYKQKIKITIKKNK